MNAQVVTTKSMQEGVIALLRSCELPYQDVDVENNLFVSYQDDEGKIIGSGGLEFYSSYALLRSVAVEETQRGRSVGKQIVADMLLRAKQAGVDEVYLLTDTAHDFFSRRGFSDINRELVPEEVKASHEYSTVCPVTASVMVYKIT
jgi:amino-acid N-acetyltransferase